MAQVSETLKASTPICTVRDRMHRLYSSDNERVPGHKSGVLAGAWKVCSYS